MSKDGQWDSKDLTMMDEFIKKNGVKEIVTIPVIKELTIEEREKLERGSPKSYSAPRQIIT